MILLAYALGTLAVVAIIAWLALHLIRDHRDAEREFRAIEQERMRGARVTTDDPPGHSFEIRGDDGSLRAGGKLSIRAGKDGG